MLGDIQVTNSVKSASLRVVITHADGTKEDLGVVSYYHRNPMRRLLFAGKQKMKELLRWI